MTAVTTDVTTRELQVDLAFSLAQTSGPVAWVGHRSPRHQWQAGVLTTVEWEDSRIVWRSITQSQPGVLDITGNATSGLDLDWARRVLGIDTMLPEFDSLIVGELARSYPGLRPYSDGSLFNGIVTSIVGQSITVAAAAVTQAKLASAFGLPIVLDGRSYWPMPRPDQLAEAPLDLIRASGVTWKRAEAIQHAARAQVGGELPSDDDARSQPEAVVKALVGLPGVGRWTAESSVLWGVGAPDAHPTGDIALLRAARAAYARPEMTLKDLDVLSEDWRPARSLAARLLWTELFGPAPVE